MYDVITILIGALSFIVFLLSLASGGAAARLFMHGGRLKQVLLWALVAALALPISICGLYWAWARGIGLV